MSTISDPSDAGGESASAVARLAARVDALLPQTQCTRCGFDACRPYAEAVAGRVSPPNRCPPGGDETALALARLIGCEASGVDPECGEPGPRLRALVEEQWCIGCTICIRACPVDAIVGAAKRMHAVLESACTGCELCVAPCPVDCIVMLPARTGPRTREAWMVEGAPAARRRFERRIARGARRRARGRRTEGGLAAIPAPGETRRLAVRDAVARVRARRAR